MNKLATIAHVAGHYPPYMGGLEQVAQTTAQIFARRGYNVVVITSDVGINKKEISEENNLTVKALKGFEFAHTSFAPTLLWHLFKLPKNSIIHLHLSQAYYPEMVLLVSKIRKIPFLVHFHLDVGQSGSMGFLLPLYKKLVLRSVLRNAGKIIVFSEEQSMMLQKKYGIKKTNIAVIPNGVGEDYFYREARAEPSDKLELLYVGRLTAQKRVERLVEAMALIDFPARLTIVGDGEDRQKLELLVKKPFLSSVVFAGKKFGAELREYYRRADAFVIPSDVEGMPLTVLEAMASGLPIVGSNVCGIRELVSSVGILVDDPSGKTFSEALGKLWREPQQLKDLSAKSLRMAEEYSWQKLAEKLETVYKGITR